MVASRQNARLLSLLCSLALAVVCHQCVSVAFTSLAPGSRSPSLLARRVTEDEKKAAREEAAKTRGVFMSLDTEEFAVDQEKMDREAALEKPIEPDIIEQAGNQASSFAVLPIALLVFGLVTYNTFFTKEAEDRYYYSAQRERLANRKTEEAGLDFRDFDSSLVQDLQEKRAKEADAEKAAAAAAGTTAPAPLIE
eukprot:CAMPEP_0177330658 /NCGR_PEP_ID=MMETSP0368-20130122/20641_1 /TAXON_ID=447022 ORGANISM="Scrippsiella hangoei-like, Strain SHHI-4" /NCGR_SAMPLE_ID=MMETSP0368 /ASSEMBLY_ACC=CAM_ASM_000363 /LENGTH=194 /DNA_ID=CAMNT_0018791001 /DNA_START=51 /DNA_END=633 /DNA_ORIENTATION=-